MVKYRIRHLQANQCLYGNTQGLPMYTWGCWADPNMAFIFDTVPCVYMVGNECFKSWNGSPSLANGMNFLLRSEYILNGQDKSFIYPFIDLMSQCSSNQYGTHLQAEHWSPFVTVGPSTLNPTADKILTILGVTSSGDTANWKWKYGDKVYWNSKPYYYCSNDMDIAQILPTGANITTPNGVTNYYFLKPWTCGYFWANRLYIDNSEYCMKSDLDSYNAILYYFTLYYQA